MQDSRITFTAIQFAGGAHVCMTHKLAEHSTDGFECWCNPTITVRCSECEPTPDQACWKCGGEGWVHMSATAAKASGAPAVIIHDEFARRAA